MITVTISTKTLADFGSDIHGAMHTLKKLEAAGVPVIGVLFPMGVTDGVLSMRADALTDDVVWTWDGEENLA